MNSSTWESVKHDEFIFSYNVYHIPCSRGTFQKDCNMYEKDLLLSPSSIVQYIVKLSASFKGAATDMRYFARSKFSRSLVHMKSFSLM